MTGACLGEDRGEAVGPSASKHPRESVNLRLRKFDSDEGLSELGGLGFGARVDSGQKSAGSCGGDESLCGDGLGWLSVHDGSRVGRCAGQAPACPRLRARGGRRGSRSRVPMVVWMVWTAQRFTQADWPERPLTVRATVPCRPTRRQPVCGSIAEGDRAALWLLRSGEPSRVVVVSARSCRRLVTVFDLARRSVRTTHRVRRRNDSIRVRFQIHGGGRRTAMPCR